MPESPITPDDEPPREYSWHDTRPKRSSFTRRALLGAGTIAAVAGAHYWVRKRGWDGVVDDLRRLDAWWHDEPPHHPIPNTKEVADYRAYLAGFPLRYLRPDEVLRPHFKKRSGTLCGLPPRPLWPRLGPTLQVADELRERLGVPLRSVTSAYRSPEYNAKCPGAARHSQHLQNRALDLVFTCPPTEAFAAARQLRDEGFFKGGIGLYKTFIHIDTRGRNATWGA